MGKKFETRKILTWLVRYTYAFVILVLLFFNWSSYSKNDVLNLLAPYFAGITPAAPAAPPQQANMSQQKPPEEIPIILPNYIHPLPFDSVSMHPGALAISADGTIAAHITLDGSVVVWDATTYEVLETLQPEGKDKTLPGSLALNADGKLLAIGHFDSSLFIRSLPEHKTLRELRGHVGAISALTFSPDGQLLASGGDDATTIVWDVTTGRRLHSFDSQFEESGGGIPVGLGFSTDKRTLAVNEWYSRHYDVERGTTLWDLKDGIEIGVLGGAPPNGDSVMRSGQAVGANNQLLAYTSRDGLALQRLDACDKANIVGPTDLEHNQPNGSYADTVAADPQGRWAAALDYQQLLFYGTSGNASPVSLNVPIRPIALVPHPAGNRLFALAISKTRRNGNEYFIIGRDAETVTAGALYAITLPAELDQLPALSTKADAKSCPPSPEARKQWAFRLPDKAPALLVKARLAPPGEIPSYESAQVLQDRERYNPPSDLYFDEGGTLYVLHYARSNAQSGVVAWDPTAKKVLRSHFQLYVGENIFRLREGWGNGEYHGQYVDLLTGNLLLNAVDDKSNVGFSTDVETGDIYRIVDGQLERFGADAKLLPLATRKETRIIFAIARNGNLAIIYADGAGEALNVGSGKSWSFDAKAMLGNDGCGIDELPRLSADGQYLQVATGCVDSPTHYDIISLRGNSPGAIGPVLGPFPKHSTRIVAPDSRVNHLDVVDLGKGELLVRLPRHPSRDKNGRYGGLLAAISDDGGLVASASVEGLVRVWDIDAKRLVGEAKMESPITSMAFNSTVQSLAVGLSSGEVIILDVKDSRFGLN